MKINEKLKQICIKDCTCLYFDEIIKIEYLESDIFPSSSNFLITKYFFFFIKKVFLHERSFP